MQLTQTKKQKNVEIYDERDPQKIQYSFEKLLYVPEKDLKPQIIYELMVYLKDKLEDESYPLKIFIAKEGRIISGIIVCQIDPTYRTYGRKCGTFGWLYALDSESCKMLIDRCEEFMMQNKIRKIRGPINYPKIIGGFGFQISGFDQDQMTGVPFNHPDSREIDFLTQFGYLRESKYWCVKVTKEYWKKGRDIPEGLKVHFPTLEEFKHLKEEILQLGQESFNAIFADTSGVEKRFEEIIRLYEIFQNLPDDQSLLQRSNDPSQFTDTKAFIKVISKFDFSKRLPWVTLIFTVDNRQLVGVGLLLPNIYQVWAGKTLNQGNGDTVMIHPDYIGKGVFSLGHNIGQIPLKMHGITHIEGTQLWANNKHAIEVMFPHTKVVRKHVVFQKRLNRTK